MARNLHTSAKFILAAILSSLLAASCCPQAPIESPAYVEPTK